MLKKLVKRGSLFLLSALTLTGCAVDLKADDFTSKLIPSWVSFVTQVAATIILVIVFIFLAYKPVKKIIKKRQDYIESNIKDSEINKTRANENAIKSEALLIESQKKANEIVEAAKIEAIKQQELLVEETNKKITKMKLDAQNDIERSKLEAKDEIRKEIVSLAIDASSEILSREINEKDNAKLAEDFIRSVKD